MARVIISLGSNLGNRVLNLNAAISRLQEATVDITLQSLIFESEPWGFETDSTFLNQVLELQTNLSAPELLDVLLNIEKELGRERKMKSVYESRPIDIDILFYDKLVVHTENLQIPHPRIQARRFVLEPLAQILPGFIHPVLQKSARQLLDECGDKLWVKKYIR